MLEIVAERGYEAVTVRELAQVAGVSSRAFYQNYSGKEECFLRTYEVVVRRAAKRIVASQAGEREWRGRLRLAFRAFARELALEPQAARLALIEAYTAGPRVREQVRCTETMFEAMVGESFARSLDQVEMPLLLVNGIVAGATNVARSKLLAGHVEDPDRFGDELLEWALGLHRQSNPHLAVLDRRSWFSGLTSELPKWGKKKGRGRANTNDGALILSAVTKIVAIQGYKGLTISHICAGAGVSRRKFNAHFAGVKDCFLAVLESRAGEAIGQAAHAKTRGETGPGGIYLAIATLCVLVARDPVLAKFCFIDVFEPGLGGMYCRERLLSHIVDIISDGVRAPSRKSDLAVKASVGGVWGVLHQRVVSGQEGELPRCAASLSTLALAPVVGMAAAIDAIELELVA